jgi:uncharacterized repeat protein (TIGR01451 family)
MSSPALRRRKISRGGTLVAVVAALAALVVPSVSAGPMWSEGHHALSTEKVADASTGEPGSQNGYTITITNPGTYEDTLVSITDDLPTGFSYIPGSTSGATTDDPHISGQRLCWSGYFPVPGDGGTISLHFQVVVTEQPGTYYNEAEGEALEHDVDPTGPTAPITVSPTGADLDVTQTDTPDPVSAGFNVSYQLSITNSGPEDASDVQLVDVLPDSTTLFETIPSQGTCTPDAGSVACDLGGIPAGQGATVKVVVTTPPGTEPTTITNQATVSSPEPDPQPGNNSSSESTSVQPRTQDQVSGWVDGGVLATGKVASPQNPQVTMVRLPTGVSGAVIIVEQAGILEACPEPYVCFGQVVEITSPDAQQPRLRFKFVFDASEVPPGTTVENLQMFHDGVLVEPCAGGGVDPCVWAKGILASGDLKVLVLTSRNGSWRPGK